MDKKILSVLNIAKKKAGAAILCGAIVLSVGSGTTFAANTTDTIQVKSDNGIKTYSTDGGQTWSEIAPEGVRAIKFKHRTFVDGVTSKDGKGLKVLMKSENGVKLYSTDGGQTWSETAPEGMPTIKFKDGALMGGVTSKDGKGLKVLMKSENGVKHYSTDGGQTWSETAPK